MTDIVTYPELPSGYVWRKPGKLLDGQPYAIGINDYDIYNISGTDLRLVVFVSKSAGDTEAYEVNQGALSRESVVDFLPKRNLTRQEAMDYAASLIWMGELS